MVKSGFILILSILIFLASCDSGEIECVRASSNTITESRELKDFDGVVFNTVGDVFISQGPAFDIKITGPDNVVTLTTMKVENNLLVIGSDACFNGAYDLKVEITAPEFSLINLSGVGDIQSVGMIESDILNMEMMGIGKIIAQVEADTLATVISGTGDVTYSGSVIKHELICSGTYALNAYELQTERTYIELTGTGDSYVSANQLLDVTITGSGNVYYKGTPVVNKEIIGTGDVMDAN